MRWQTIQDTVHNQPLFTTSHLLAGDITRHQVQRQLSDWTKAEKILQLRRGVYAFPNKDPHPFIVANYLIPSSYISLQMALGYYHLIPEHVVTVTCVTTQRPAQYQNKFGRFTYRHINPKLFYGIEYRLLVGDRYAYIATPEKALLDLVYFWPQGDSPDYLHALRLQHLDTLNIDQLHRFAEKSGKPKLKRAATVIESIAKQEEEEYEAL